MNKWTACLFWSIYFVSPDYWMMWLLCSLRLMATMCILYFIFIFVHWQRTHVLVGPVPRPGQYAAIVHYYQPNHASFESQVSVTSDRALDGSMKFHYCPHASGCRSVVRNLIASPLFNIGRNSVALEFTIPENSSTWIVSVKNIYCDFYVESIIEDHNR